MDYIESAHGSQFWANIVISLFAPVCSGATAERSGATAERSGATAERTLSVPGEAG
jgi:hypothetical protein